MLLRRLRHPRFSRNLTASMACCSVTALSPIMVEFRRSHHRRRVRGCHQFRIGTGSQQQPHHLHIVHGACKQKGVAPTGSV